MEDIYSKNVETMRTEEIKEGHRREKVFPHSWTGRINIVKMAFLHIYIYILRSSVIAITIPMACFTFLHIEKNPKIHINLAQKGTRYIESGWKKTTKEASSDLSPW